MILKVSVADSVSSRQSQEIPCIVWSCFETSLRGNLVDKCRSDCGSVRKMLSSVCVFGCDCVPVYFVCMCVGGGVEVQFVCWNFDIKIGQQKFQALGL